MIPLLRRTWRWWLPPVVFLALVAAAATAWLLSVPDSPIHYTPV